MASERGSNWGRGDDPLISWNERRHHCGEPFGIGGEWVQGGSNDGKKEQLDSAVGLSPLVEVSDN